MSTKDAVTIETSCVFKNHRRTKNHAAILGYLVLGCLAICLSGCSIEAGAPRELKDFVEKVERLSFSGDAEGLRHVMAPEASASATDDQISRLTSVYPGVGPPVKETWVDLRFDGGVGTRTDWSTAQLVRQLEFPDGTVVVRQRISRSQEGIRLLAMDAALLSSEQVVSQTFYLTNRPTVNYVFLVAFLALPTVSIITVIAIWTGSETKRRIIWSAFCLFGIGSITFNWHTGEIGTNVIQRTPEGFYLSLLQFYPLSVYATKLPIGPWILTLALPLGTLVYWIARLKK